MLSCLIKSKLEYFGKVPILSIKDGLKTLHEERIKINNIKKMIEFLFILIIKKTKLIIIIHLFEKRVSLIN